MTLVQRLVLLISAVVAILLGVWLYEAAFFRRVQEAAVGNEMERALSLVSSEYGAFVERAQNVLSVAAVEAPEAAIDPKRCKALVTSLQAAGLEWLRLDVLDTREVVECSTDLQAVGADMSGYPEVKAARTEGRPRIGNYTWGLFSGTLGLAMARPWVGPRGATGVVAAVAKLDPFAASLLTLLPKGYDVVMADRGGRVIAAEPEGRDIIGRILPASLEALTRMPTGGRIRGRWTDGSARIIVYSPADAQRHEGVFIALGVDPGAAAVPGLGFLYASGLGLLTAALTTIMLAWWGGVRFIRRPLGELAAVALRWRDGDQTARVALPGRSEIAALGRVFNAMADAKDQSDRQTREGVELLTALIESSRDGIFVFGRDGRLLIANSTFLDLAGLARDTAVGRELFVPHDPSVRYKVDGLRARVVETRVPQAADVGIQGRDGETHVLQTICAPIFSEHGEVQAVAGIGRDITEAREAAQSLRQARDRAEAADRAKTRFLAAASHDLRQPLQAAIMLADLVAQTIGGNNPASRSADNLCHALDDLKRLVDSLFDVSRLDAGNIQPELTVFPLQPLLWQITITYREMARSKGIALVVSDTDAIIRSDRTLLARLLSNLIDNAIKYTQSGRVTVDCHAKHGALQISIADTGVGISSEDLSRIWLEFEQLHNQQRDRRQGLGLGLAIVRRLSALLEHPVEVRSEPGRGSCFTASIPLIESPEVALADQSSAKMVDISCITGHVVVIDDDPLVLDVLHGTLEEYGWEVTAALDGSEAMQRLEFVCRAPDVAVVDYRLGGGQVGADAVAILRQTLGRELPAIILTGELAGAGEEPDRLLQDAQRIGAVLLRKPIRSRELIEAMTRLIAASTVPNAQDAAVG